MKKLFSLFPMLCILLMQTSCNTAHGINTSKPLANVFLDKNSNEVIGTEQMLERIAKDANLGKNQQFIELSLKKLNKSEKTKADDNN
ncbi:hypothetical protein [Riemerella columbipharyngis]|uniref:Uncharacterized protein n=1 Tax=Riemerella columbipharyngis TaxID=1071918 RepID=A0A1G7DZ25_9FLAO|nr:hypothetical protein [Riemerella columbipharyngis]SDE56642.1 hypothetical protein SAMN05421544_11339 [Riemerella columbipharyngis]